MDENEVEREISALVTAAIVETGKALVGVPASLVTNTVKILGRLTGGVAAIPSAWIESKVQRIKDDAAAKSAISKVLIDAATKQIAEKPEYVDAALDNWAGDVVRRHNNKRLIAAATVEEVARQSDTSSGTDDDSKVEQVDDDWINVFSQYAENASTERMQRLWARVAAGEARQPGAFSLSTLRLVSELDKQSADDFSLVANYFVGDVIFPDEAWERGELFTLTMRMHGQGLFLGRKGDARRFINTDASGQGNCLFSGKDCSYAISITGLPNIEKDFQIIMLSKQAQELATLLPAGNPWDRLRQVAQKLDKTDLSMVDIYKLDGNLTIIRHEVVWIKQVEQTVST